MATVAPATAQDIPPHCLKRDLRKVCVVPESIIRDLTEEQKQLAVEYARQHGIRWRIAKGK